MLVLAVAGTGVRGWPGAVYEQRAEQGGGEDTGVLVGAGCDADPRRLRKRQGLPRVAASGLGLPEREKAEGHPKHKRWHKQRTMFISLSACLIRLSLAESPCGITKLFFALPPSSPPPCQADTGLWGGVLVILLLYGVRIAAPAWSGQGTAAPSLMSVSSRLSQASSCRLLPAFSSGELSSLPSRAGVGLTSISSLASARPCVSSSRYAGSRA